MCLFAPCRVVTPQPPCLHAFPHTSLPHVAIKCTAAPHTHTQSHNNFEAVVMRLLSFFGVQYIHCTILARHTRNILHTKMWLCDRARCDAIERVTTATYVVGHCKTNLLHALLLLLLLYALSRCYCTDAAPADADQTPFNILLDASITRIHTHPRDHAQMS